jgi:hypothetical protein
MDQIFESKKNTTNLVGQINPTNLVEQINHTILVGYFFKSFPGLKLTLPI